MVEARFNEKPFLFGIGSAKQKEMKVAAEGQVAPPPGKGLMRRGELGIGSIILILLT